MFLASGKPWARLENILLLGAFALQAYFSNYNGEAVDQASAQRPEIMARTEWSQAWGKVDAKMVDIRAVNGVPMCASRQRQ